MKNRPPHVAICKMDAGHGARFAASHTPVRNVSTEDDVKKDIAEDDTSKTEL